MAGFYGADVASLRSLAASFDRAAHDLSAAGTTLDGLVRTHTAWTGPSADRFRQQWSGVDRARVTATVNGLHEAAARLRANASAQESVSQGDGGSAGGSLSASLPGGLVATSMGGGTSILPRIFGGISGAWERFQQASDAVDTVSKRLDLGARLAGGIGDAARLAHQAAVGALTGADARTVLEGIGADVAAGGHDGALNVFDRAIGAAHLAGNSTLEHVLTDAERGSMVLHGAAGIAGGIASVVNYGSLAVGDVQMVDKLVNGHASASDLLSTVGDNLSFGPPLSPVHLIGDIAHIGAWDMQLAKQSDFSPSGVSLVTSYIAKNPGAIASSLGQAVATVVPKVFGWAL